MLKDKIDMLVDELTFTMSDIEIMMVNDTTTGLRKYIVKKLRRAIHSENVKSWRAILTTDTE